MNNDSEILERKNRILRRSLYAVVVLSICIICIPMIVATVEAIQNGTAIDPFTGNQFQANEKTRSQCIIKGGELLRQKRENELSQDDYQKSLAQLKMCVNLYPDMYKELEKQR